MSTSRTLVSFESPLVGDYHFRVRVVLFSCSCVGIIALLISYLHGDLQLGKKTRRI